VKLREASLAIVSHKAHDLDPTTGKVHVRGGFLHLTNEFAQHARRVVLCVPTRLVREAAAAACVQDYAPNVELRPLPPFTTRRQLLRQLPQVMREIRGAIDESDITYAMCPGDPGLLALATARWLRTPYFVSIDTDRAQKALASPDAWLTRQAAFRFYHHLVHPYLRLLAWDRPTFVTGDMFLGTFPNWHQWIKTTHRSDSMPALHIPGAIGDTFTVAFAGRLSHEKSVETLIDAVGVVRTQGIAATLVIIGDGPRREALRVHAARVIAGAHRFLGDVDNREIIGTRFFGAHVLVLPSIEERQGKVLLEAMATSVPVIATRTGGIPTVVEDGVNGLLVAVRDVVGLAEALRAVYESVELRQTLAANGHAFAAKHGLDVEIARIVRIVDESLGIR
jgi:glycosyltransferase involved in cell wall biosynthesis